ncbi:aspartyl/glutamyl-tRNA(Asn/Gln) amidotransferase subunit A [Sinobaca qinghaiensis]|uniref:Glutamyl-tRNA(Gln) amidotransferase subunit A n=1 Tax=Sinobaca qinghaiensis TaxID=342944 RepID=A0A419UZV1_9BACL|nr:Asp-tRNA(Asn)/Glu-tRNA(Gln) amidotransferase subunit GatA [Sinobaca qinghaiensis]RKD71212.1 aspartyl/glutamyl-tRNA(Asn/Gln) amidotransferase subunit A [Sinobaca qinghaiensis]
MSILEESFSSVHKKLENKEIKVSELVDASYNRINEVDDKVKAFLTLNEEQARAHAKTLDEAIAEDRINGMLFGLPGGIKDNIVTKNLRTTCASQLLDNFIPVYDATVVEGLQQASSINIGKLNMDEFAMGSSNENSSYKVTRNPWDIDRVPGGSSGGSAASVAAGEVMFSLGSDTGGSIREPAAYCGVVGMKPTYGRVSRFGLVAFASSLDQVGPLTRTVEDNARVLQEIAGHCEKDSTSADVELPDFSADLQKGVKGLKIAVPKEYIGEGVKPEIKDKVMDALKVLESQGATWEEVSLPHSKYAVAAYYLLSSSEASANLSRFDGVRFGVRHDSSQNLIEMYKETRSKGFGDEVKRRIMLGTFALSSGYYDAYYKKAQQVRHLIKNDFDDVLSKYDVIIGPTAPTVAFKVGEQIDDPLTMYANDILTIPVNLAGVPAISVPCGFSENMPVGLQIIASPFDEKTIYQVAHSYEQATEHHKAKAEL